MCFSHGQMPRGGREGPFPTSTYFSFTSGGSGRVTLVPSCSCSALHSVSPASSSEVSLSPCSSLSELSAEAFSEELSPSSSSSSLDVLSYLHGGRMLSDNVALGRSFPGPSVVLPAWGGARAGTGGWQDPLTRTPRSARPQTAGSSCCPRPRSGGDRPASS